MNTKSFYKMLVVVLGFVQVWKTTMFWMLESSSCLLLRRIWDHSLHLYLFHGKCIWRLWLMKLKSYLDAALCIYLYTYIIVCGVCSSNKFNHFIKNHHELLWRTKTKLTKMNKFKEEWLILTQRKIYRICITLSL